MPSGHQWNVSGTGKGLWEAFVEVHWRPHYFDDREIGGGRALERAGRLGLELSLRSDPHRAVSASMSLATRSTYNGSETYLNGVLALRPRDDLELDVDPDVTLAPGSTVFLVYSHAQIPSDDGTTFDVRSLPRGPSQNVVLLKPSWAWLR